MNERAWDIEVRAQKETLRPYHSPLPKKFQRTSHYKWQRSGKVRHYDPMECFWIGLQRTSQELALEVANTILILWEEQPHASENARR